MDRNAGFRCNDSRRGDAAVDFAENRGNVVVTNQPNQFDELLGGGFTTGLLLHSGGNFQTKGVGKIPEAIVEGNQLPAGKVLQLFLTVCLETLQLSQYAVCVFPENSWAGYTAQSPSQMFATMIFAFSGSSQM